MARPVPDEKEESFVEERRERGCVLEKPIVIYLQAYFLTIASVLGTGILGLPVTLSKSGFSPFLTIFSVGFFIQACIVYFFVDLLQKASIHLRQQYNVLTKSEDISMSKLDGVKEASSSEEEIEDAANESLSTLPKGLSLQEIHSLGLLQPNLHNMGQLFLGPWSRYAFDVLILVMFLSFITSYSLAGSQAFQQLFNINSLQSVIPFFVGVNVTAILFAQFLVKPLVSVLTFFKGILLSVTVVVAFVVGSKVNNKQSTDFGATGDTFLMGTVAMGGVINIMPLMYSRVKAEKTMVKNFRRAVFFGLLTCALLNVLWCSAVLSIVPQQCSLCPSPASRPVWLPANLTKTCCAKQSAVEVPDKCVLCLQQADNHGRISTVPLINVVKAHYPRFSWMARLVELFIIVSITVSFLVYGSSLKQTWDGLASSVVDERRRRLGCFSLHRLLRWLAYLLSFGGVFLIAMNNPEGFVYIIDRAGSLCINLEIILFLMPMVRRAWKEPFRLMQVALPLPGWFYWLYVPMAVYSLYAVVYDLAELIADQLFT